MISRSPGPTPRAPGRPKQISRRRGHLDERALVGYGRLTTPRVPIVGQQSGCLRYHPRRSLRLGSVQFDRGGYRVVGSDPVWCAQALTLSRHLSTALPVLLPMSLAPLPLPLNELASAFRQRGELMAPFAPAAARAFADCAEWLEASIDAHLEAPLTLEQAVRESNWSYEGLRRRLKLQPSLNVGKERAPLIRRRDLAALGAPRGPRGQYRPRKAASSAPPGNGIEQPPVGACEHVAGPERDTMSPPVDQTGDDRDVTVDQMPEASDAALAAQSTARRTTPTVRRPRRHSTKERFSDIQALAALG